jgi:hypothetical protein
LSVPRDKEQEGACWRRATRIPIPQFLAPPKTTISSKLRKDVQAKALAVEKVTTAGEMEVGEGGKESKDGEQKIKKKKKTEKEEEEDDREMNEVRALLKEQDNQDYEDASLDFNFEKFFIKRM